MSITITLDTGDLAARLHAITERMVDDAQRITTVEAKKAADLYTPMDEGNLRDNFEYTVDERGVPDGWTYLERYAWRQWNGLTKDGRPFNYSKDRNSLASSHWAEHGVVNQEDDIANAVKAALQ